MSRHRRDTTRTAARQLPAADTAGPTNQLQPNQALAPGQALASPDGRFQLVYQGNGNLVLYDGFRAVWTSNTAGKPAGELIMQGDGNLVIYAPDRTPLWASNSYRSPGSHLVMQDDGNVVIYDPAGRAVWATMTVLAAASGNQMLPTQVLFPGQALVSGHRRFVYQGDGNLVLYDYSDPVWATNTAGKPAGELIMQGDGNLVIYAPDRTPLWASNSYRSPGSHLVMQDDGNVVIYDPAGRPVWATMTLLPVVSNVQAADIGQNTATLTSTINAEGSATAYSFQYGVTAQYGSNTPIFHTGSAFQANGVAISIGNLRPGTTYHYRLVAQNSGGMVVTGDYSFTTESSAPHGIARVSVFNCDSDGDSVYFWAFDETTGTWQIAGSQSAMYDTFGNCPAADAAPVLFTPANNHVYVLVAVDTGMAGCSGSNDPRDGACIRWEAFGGNAFEGDPNGPAVGPFTVT